MSKVRHIQYNPKRPVVNEGDSPNDKELQVWSLVGQGKSNKEIANHLHYSESTIKVHMNHLFAKLGQTNRVQLALLWHGIDISEQQPKQPTERDLREMVARDCFNLHRERMGIRDPWERQSESRKDAWRKNVTMGVVMHDTMLPLRDGT